jgi:hypothetical protein
MSHPIDITNQRFGRLVAIRRAGSNSRGRALWLCQCDCGNKKIAPSQDLRNGKIQSCKCLQNENRERYFLAHGHSRRDSNSPEYRAWAGMLARCRDPKNQYYGGRGIKVCKHWFRFENFLSDMGLRPRNHFLDRINVNGNYKPSNCRWGTLKEHQQNKRPRQKVGTIDKFTIAELKAELKRRRYATPSTRS